MGWGVHWMLANLFTLEIFFKNQDKPPNSRNTEKAYRVTSVPNILFGTFLCPNLGIIEQFFFGGNLKCSVHLLHTECSMLTQYHYHHFLIFLIHSHHWLMLPPWACVPIGDLRHSTGQDHSQLDLMSFWWEKLFIMSRCLNNCT